MSTESHPTIPPAATTAAEPGDPATGGAGEAPTAGAEPVTAEGPAALDVLDAIPDLPDDTWPTGPPAAGIRVPAPVAGLALVLAALLGAAGGARLKGDDQGTAGAGGTRNGAAAAAAGAGQGGFTGRQPGGQGGGVAGTVKAVDGERVTLTGADGRDTTVALSQATTITRTEAGQPGDITVGQTVTVRGTGGADGTTQAATVIIGAAAGGAGPAGAAAPPTTAAP